MFGEYGYMEDGQLGKPYNFRLLRRLARYAFPDKKIILAALVLTTFITLTPGTLSLDVSSDRRTLYIHSMYVDDVEEFRESIKQGYERRVKEVLR